MKKVLKRSLSLLLAITIIMGSAFVGLSEVDFDGIFVVEAKAASPKVTKSQAVAWLNNQQDKVYDFNNADGTQCTEFVRAYVNYVMTGDPWKSCGYTNDMDGWVVWKSSYWANNKDGWTVYKNTTDFMPQPGDIFCAGSLNHTGVVISSTLYTADIADGNGRDLEWSNGDPVSIRNITWSRYAPTYFIRPHFSDTPIPALKTPTITFNKSSYTEGDTITLTWTASPSDSNLSHYWINVRNPDSNLVINEKIDKSTTEYSFITPGIGTYGVTMFATPYGSASGEGSLTDTKSITIAGMVSTYTVTYDANGGTGAPSAQTKYHDSALAISTTKPTRSGYTFVGWSASKTATSATYLAGSPYTANSSVTLYAVWRNNTYTVSYNANGGTGVPGSSAHSNGSTHTLSSTVPTRFGYTFMGWGKTANSSTIYSPGYNYTVTSNTTFYAIWMSAYRATLNSSHAARIPYAGYYEYYIFEPSTTLKYRFESTGTIDSKITLYDSTGAELATNDDGGSNLNFALEQTLEGGQTYYIKVYAYGSNTGDIPFTVKGFCNITYDANGGADAPSLQELFAGESTYLASSAPRRLGYTFLGWSESPDATTPQYQPGDTFYANRSVTLYAVWETSTMGNYLEYYVGGDGITISDCDETYEGELIIPDTIDGYPVTCIGDEAFRDCKNITSITIPDSVITIGSAAFCDCESLISITIPDSITEIKGGFYEGCFQGCTNLTSITIPDSVTSIGDYAFAYCENLTSITIPDNVTSIGDDAFAHCENLTSITIPDSVTSIGGAFFNCTSLTSINIPDNVTNIDNFTFCGCDSLTSITIPDNVTSIGEYAFSGCDSLTSITIPDSVISIGEYAFRDCTSLISVTIPDSVASIGNGCFGGCISLVSINVESSNENYCSVDGILFNKAQTELIQYPAGKTNASYTIPDGVTSIRGSAFNGCTNLTSITIPDSVTTIGGSAFYHCTTLISITIPDSVKKIDDQAFWGCDSLATVIIGSGLTSIAMDTFVGCESLTSIIIGSSVTRIGNHAFYGCTSLTSITIPDSVTSIGSEPFGGCTSLVSINVDSSNETYCSVDGVLFNKAQTELIQYPTGRTSVSYTIPDGVTNIGYQAFYNCTNLTSVAISESVTSIGWRVFNSCDNLNYIFYSGTEDEWSNIVIQDYNKSLENAIIHYNSTDHTYNDWMIDAEPTCTDSGHKHRVCSVCDYIDNTEVTASSGHRYSDWIITSYAYCTINGSREKICSVCGDVFTEEILATGHKNTMWITELEPDCTMSGYKDEWCLDCGSVVNTEIIPANGHSEGEWTVDVEPNCTDEGSKHKLCTVCNEAVTEVIPANGHSHSAEWTIDVAPTCEGEGSKSHHCTVCGDKADITVIEPLGHIYSTEWTIDVAPTCTEEGSKSHHCTGCDEMVADVTVIEALGHNYKLVSVAEEHPHTNTFKCSRCTDTKTESSYSDKCGVCNFSYTDVDSATCRITGYIGGKSTFAIPATINGKTVSTTTTGAFKNNTTLTSVKIEEGVQGLGALAFLGCSSLSKVVIPESVTSIGANAFYNCASDFTIYCFRDSYAMQYAIDNSLNYVVMDIGETDNCTIDYDNELIYVSIDGLTSIDDILYVPADSMVFAEASLISGAKEFLGTGSTVTVFDGNDISSEYTLIVNGDTNGDSVCDALDAAQVALVSNGHKTIDGAYKMAADNNRDDEISIEDYQAIVNKAIA